MSNSNVFGAVAEGFAKSTRNVTNINAANMSAVMHDTGYNFNAATAPNPGMVKVMEAEGLGNKIRVMGENLKEGMRENAELDRQYREHVQSHESYRQLLEEQRISRQATINGTKYGRGKLNHPRSGDVQVIVPMAAPQRAASDY